MPPMPPLPLPMPMPPKGAPPDCMALGGGVFRKKAIGSCLCTAGPDGPASEDMYDGEDAGEGAEKRSSGRPEAVMAALFGLEEPLGPPNESFGSARPPSPDRGASSSANASNEMRSCAFWFGLVLDRQPRSSPW